MITNSLVSVIIPCFRQAHYLNDCITSLQAQTYSKWEAIVVDDGSPDETATVVRSLAQTDSRISLVQKKNGGLSSARNAGLVAANGEFIQFLDADDLLESDKFERDLSCFSRPDAPDLVFSGFSILLPDGKTELNDRTRPRFNRPDDPELELAISWETALSIPIHTALLRASLLRQHQIRFNETLPNHEDWDFWMRVFKSTSRVATRSEPGAIYRATIGSMTRNRDAMFTGFMKAIENRMGDPTIRPEVKDALRAKLSLTRHHYGHGWRGRLLRVTRQNWYRRNIPWPMQQSITALFDLDTNLRTLKLEAKYLTKSSRID